MSNELEKVGSKEIAVTDADLVGYLNTFAGTAALTKTETTQFISIAKAFNLNPFKREIYAVAYESKGGRKLSIITGYEVYLKRAERLGTLDGWEVSVEGSGDDMKAILIIYRKDWSHPFKHEAYFAEVAKKNYDGKPQSMWATMPRFMLKKVAVAQGFRMAFPDEFGGMPYTADELPENMTKTTAGTAENPEVIPPEVTNKPEGLTPAEKAQIQQEETAGNKHVLADGEQVPAWFMALPGAEKMKWAPKGFSISGGKICVRKAS